MSKRQVVLRTGVLLVGFGTLLRTVQIMIITNNTIVINVVTNITMIIIVIAIIVIIIVSIIIIHLVNLAMTMKMTTITFMFLLAQHIEEHCM